MDLVQKYNLKVNDPVIFTYNEEKVHGIIGEINDNTIYVWHNQEDQQGSRGDLIPQGHKYSRAFNQDSDSTSVQILNADTLNKQNIERIYGSKT